jgi:methionyl-tRNA formyltransferase
VSSNVPPPAPLRIAFFGLPLAALLLGQDGHALPLCVLSPVPHPGRRRLARRNRDSLIVDALEEDSDLEGRVDAFFESHEVDLLVSWFWTRKLPERWLARPLRGPLGAHPSLLPRHRGPNPFFGAIDAGDAVTGVTVHRLTAEYDRGNILDRVELPVGDRDAWQLARALDRPSLKLLRSVVARFAGGHEVPERAQDERLATWAPEPAEDLARVDFRWPTARVLRRIRALSPVPGLALEIRGIRLFVTGATPTASYPRALLAGEAAVVPGADPRLVIRTGDGAILVQRAQLAADEGSVPISAEALAGLVSLRGEVLDSVALEPEGDE